MNRKRLNDAIKRNVVDKRALDMLDAFQCTRDVYEDIQMEVLRIQDKFDAYDGAFGNVCKLAAEFRQYADMMFKVYYSTLSDDEREAMSDDVFKLVSDTNYWLCFGKEVPEG